MTTVREFINNKPVTSDEIWFVYSLLHGAEKPERDFDLAIAKVLGWTSIQTVGIPYRWVGINPSTQRFEDIPHFTESVDAAYATKPPLWVFKWNERHDQMHLVKARPRGDLGLFETPEEMSQFLALAICATGIHARFASLYMKERADVLGPELPLTTT